MTNTQTAMSHTEQVDAILADQGIDHTDLADNVESLTADAFPGWSQRRVDRTLGQRNGTRCYYCCGFASDYLPVHRAGGFDSTPWLHDGCELALARQLAEEMERMGSEFDES